MNTKVNEVSKFLQACTDSNQTYTKLKDLLLKLQADSTRTQAIGLLNALHKNYERCVDKKKFITDFHFCFDQIELGSEKLTLLQLPSIFSPEEWSFTFYEGLSRYPVSSFFQKKIVELGCGNGWISIALALFYPTRSVVGLDINPRAVTCASINLYLNSLDEEGIPKQSIDGRKLWERLKFTTSDLLGELIRIEENADIVIGCIPQVLAPNAEELLKVADEFDTDQSLYDLSNYTAAYGYIEDQFGLGLIVKAVEQAVACLNPGGRLILNLGGRPGQQVLEGLFLRRGLLMRKVWSTKVRQASDTEIDALVAIESSSAHRFEFYMSTDSNKVISAGTASKYLKVGGKIWHELSVYEASIPEHEAVHTILGFLQKNENRDLLNGIDLSSTNEMIYRERTRFLDILAKRFLSDTKLPYENTSGSVELQHCIKLYLQSYFKLAVNEKSIVIAPGRRDLFTNLCLTLGCEKVLCDQSFNSLKGSEKTGDPAVDIIETPSDIVLTKELVLKLEPDMVWFVLSPAEQQSLPQMIDLMQACAATQCRLLVDISEVFELSSHPQSNALFSYMSRYKLPHHVTLGCGLVKNQVYSDLEIAFVIDESRDLCEHLTACAELTYSRTPLMTQYYYTKIFDDLLSFHVIPKTLPERIASEASMIADETKYSTGIKAAIKFPALVRSAFSMNKHTIRLDYGENSLSVPSNLAKRIYESFIHKEFHEQESSPVQEIYKLYNKTFSGLAENENAYAFGNGVAPLFANLLQYVKNSAGTIIVPTGFYGEFDAAIALFEVNKKVCQTQAKDDFKITPRVLNESLENCPKAFVFLNAPIVNPTGSIYSTEEFTELQKVANAHKASLIIDSIFLGLAFNDEQLTYRLRDHTSYVLLGGVSKLFAAGGLRFGFACTNNPGILTALRTPSFNLPHKTVMFGVKKVLEDLNNSEGRLIADLSEQRLLLARRAQILSQCLAESEWDVKPCKGGLFLIAKPKFYGQEVNGATITPENIAKILLERHNLLVNEPSWTKIDGYCRFVLSVEESEFKQALTAIKDFYRSMFVS